MTRVGILFGRPLVAGAQALTNEADETILKKTLVVDPEGSARGERAGDDGLTVRRRDFSRLFPEEKQIAVPNQRTQ
jgi:hypothetical protein